MEYWSSYNKIEQSLTPSIAKRWASLSSQLHAIRTYDEASIWKDAALQLCDEVNMKIESRVDARISNVNNDQVRAIDTSQGLSDFVMSFFALLPSDEREKGIILRRLMLQKEEVVAERREIKAEIRTLKLSAKKMLPVRFFHWIGELTGSKERNPLHRDQSSRVEATISSLESKLDRIEHTIMGLNRLIRQVRRFK